MIIGIYSILIKSKLTSIFKTFFDKPHHQGRTNATSESRTSIYTTSCVYAHTNVKRYNTPHFRNLRTKHLFGMINGLLNSNQLTIFRSTPMKKFILSTALLAISLYSAPVVYIGKITSPDMEETELSKINEVFTDVWSEKAVFENIDDIPQKNLSLHVQSMELSDSDKVVTGNIMTLGSKKLLRVDVYNSTGLREHVSREQLTELADIYTPMIQTREEYYSPIQEQNNQITSSSNHQAGWSFSIGAGVNPKGYEYKIINDLGDTVSQEPYSLTSIDISLVDAIGKYRNNVLSCFFHYNFRADLGIGFSYSRLFFKQKPHTLTAGIEVGLNKMVIDNFMGIEEENYLGTQDGIMVGPKVGVILFRDQKVNLFTDVAYTFIVSEREANYPSVRFGMISYWGKKFKKRK